MRSVKTRIRIELFPSVFNRTFYCLEYTNEVNVLLICLKTLCVKNKVLSCSTFLYSNQRNHDRHHLNTKCHTNSENDCQPYNKQFIDLACSVCTVKYRTSFFLVVKNLSPIFHGADRTSEVNNPLLSKYASKDARIPKRAK